MYTSSDEEAAFFCYEDYLSWDTKDTDGHKELGGWYAKAGNLEEAAKHYQEAACLFREVGEHYLPYSAECLELAAKAHE